MTDTAPPRSMSSLLADILENIEQIVRAEVRLVKVEVREELAHLRLAIVLLAAGGVVLALAFGLVLLAGVYALTTVWPPWAAALAVAVVAAAAGGLLASLGSKRLQGLRLTPPRSAAVLREHIEWAKQQVR